MKKKITTSEMEVAVALFLNTRQNLIIPNVHWGMEMHECDLLMLTPSGYATEIEIKITLQDLKADAKKRHNHIDGRISALYFALPKKLEKNIDLVPNRAGIIIVDEETGWCRKIRKPEKTKKAYQFCKDEKYKIARLGAMRLWGLKEKINKISTEKKELEKRIGKTCII